MTWKIFHDRNKTHTHIHINLCIIVITITDIQTHVFICKYLITDWLFFCFSHFLFIHDWWRWWENFTHLYFIFSRIQCVCVCLNWPVFFPPYIFPLINFSHKIIMNDDHHQYSIDNFFLLYKSWYKRKEKDWRIFFFKYNAIMVCELEIENSFFFTEWILCMKKKNEKMKWKRYSPSPHCDLNWPIISL